jgi:hypothetical protein
MRGWRWAGISGLALAVACASQAVVHGGGKRAPGQEFVYSGTAERKQSTAGHPEMTTSGPIGISALVTEATPAGGYTIVLVRSAQPTVAGRRGLPAEVDVGVVRFSATGTADHALPRAMLSSPIVSLTRLVTVPFAPREGLQVGQKWISRELLPAVMPKPLELAYTVVGRTRSGGRDCLKIDKKVAQALPLVAEFGTLMKYTLTDYRGTLCVDAATSQVVSDEWQASVRQSYRQEEWRLSLKAGVTLQQTRQLSADEVASRAVQAEALDKLQTAVFSYHPVTDISRWAEQSTRMLAAFRTRFPNTAYALALAPMERYVTMRRSYAQRQARLQAMNGRPAPPFRLTDLGGAEQSLGAYRGKLILLNFFASW